MNASFGFDENDSITHDLRVILSPAQYARYVELDLQLTGAEAMARPDVARKLALTREQRGMVRQIESGVCTTTVQSGGADLDQLIQLAKKQHDETEKKLLAVLTDQQRAGWNSMLGKPFKFEEDSESK